MTQEGTTAICKAVPATYLAAIILVQERMMLSAAICKAYLAAWWSLIIKVQKRMILSAAIRKAYLAAIIDA